MFFWLFFCSCTKQPNLLFFLCTATLASAAAACAGPLDQAVCPSLSCAHQLFFVRRIYTHMDTWQYAVAQQMHSWGSESSWGGRLAGVEDCDCFQKARSLVTEVDFF